MGYLIYFSDLLALEVSGLTVRGRRIVPLPNLRNRLILERRRSLFPPFLPIGPLLRQRQLALLRGRSLFRPRGFGRGPIDLSDCSCDERCSFDKVRLGVCEREGFLKVKYNCCPPPFRSFLF
ncbi:uncharacterized protein [Argopecten irradians]|uniref:uncharacterized protein n=1 Tax=Argopecten irradians TaxID=31199 RepID=UPI0037132AE9